MDTINREPVSGLATASLAMDELTGSLGCLNQLLGEERDGWRDGWGKTKAGLSSSPALLTHSVSP